MAALTLVEASKNHRGDVLRAGTIQMFAQKSDILGVLPFETIPGGILKYEQQGTLPSVAFRGVNEAYTAGAGVLNPLSDATYIVGGDVDVDNYIIATRGEGIRAVHVEMKVAALADTWAQKFIKGDNLSEPREFDGLQGRLVGGQYVINDTGSGGGALSMKKLDKAIDAVDGPNAILMNKAMLRNMKAYLRTSTMISEAEDAFGRKITAYGGLPIYTTQNGATEALPFTEADDAAGGVVCTSIYVVHFGQNWVQGIQNGDISVRDLGELDTQPLRRVRIEWYAGLAVMHGRAAARLNSITDATAVA